MFRIFMGGLEDINVAIYTFSASNPADKQGWMHEFLRVQNDDAQISQKRVVVREASVILPKKS